jgi:exodeoxyribonuclease VII large subunit
MEYASATPAPAPAREIYTVSRLNREAKLLLEGSFPPLWIEGEISNLARPSSGHLYFCLKDAGATVRCALFRTQLRLLRIAPREGMHVMVRARLTLYEGRGEYQLIVELLEDAGEGALRRAFDLLKTRLAQEGLFDSARKRPLPRLPRRIGLITSPSGAVLHDIVTTLRRRFPAIPVLLYPVPVQGEAAGTRIAEAIRVAGVRRDCDVLILARGGGSLEDLWAFNEEVVARAIVACPIPIVSGVGHETDFTIADLAADVRAPTPTAAAELLSPDQNEWRERFCQLEVRLLRRLQDKLRGHAQHIDWLAARLIHPRARLEHLDHRWRALAHRLLLAQARRIQSAYTAYHRLNARLERCLPLARVRAHRLDCRHLQERLHGAMHRSLRRERDKMTHVARALHTLSPLATLDRGYAIVRDGASGAILRDARTVAPGDSIDARLARGHLTCVVKERHDE